MITGITASRFDASQSGNTLLQGLEEILGEEQVQSLLEGHFPAVGRVARKGTCLETSEFGGLLQASLEKKYGTMAGRGLAVRSGRASFKYVLRKFNSQLGFTDLEFRLLPVITRMKSAGQSLAMLASELVGQKVCCESSDEYLTWRFEPTAGHEKTACHLMMGLLQEAISWINGGKFYQVEEICCLGKGDTSCAIRIRKKPIQ